MKAKSPPKSESSKREKKTEMGQKSPKISLSMSTFYCFIVYHRKTVN